MPLGTVKLVRRRKAGVIRDWAPEDNSRMSVERYISYHYNEQAKKPGKGRKRGVLHPSWLKHCERKQQLDLLYAPKNRVTLPVKVLRLFDNGHSSESRMRATLIAGCEMLGAKFTPSVDVVDEEYLIAGEADGILETEKGHLWIVDFKTINRKNFDALVRPDEGYIWQQHAYMRAMRIPQMVLYYECKDRQLSKEVVIRFGDKTWAQIHRVIERILRAMHREELLPIDSEKCDGPQCQFHAVCFSNPSFDDVDQRPPYKRHLPVLGSK